MDVTDRRDLYCDDRPGIALINRDFWTEGNVLGEALLALAESLSSCMAVTVITQSSLDLESKLASASRGKNVKLCAIQPLSTSTSSLFRKGIEAVRLAGYVFFVLWRRRPSVVYVATNPPIVVPFLCMLYCRWTSSRLVYHVQDIHPEITDIVTTMRPWLFRFLKRLDCYVLNHASKIVTINAIMRQEIMQRARPQAEVHLLENPALDVNTEDVKRKKGFVYCGNAGRLQRIPVLLAAIRGYYKAGGTLPFVFVGGGVYKYEFSALSLEFPLLQCLGEMSPDAAARIMASFEWAVLPLEDEVMKFAFPSKSASYLLAGAKIMTISTPESALASWVKDNKYGLNVSPEVTAIVTVMREIEGEEKSVMTHSHETLLARYGIHRFTDTLAKLLKNESACDVARTFTRNRTIEK